MMAKQFTSNLVAQWMIIFIFFATVPAITAIPGHAWADILYDVNFGTPPHIVGLPPVEGVSGPPPRDKVSRTDSHNGNLLEVFVTDNFGPLDQPLEFNSSGSEGPSCRSNADCPDSFCNGGQCIQ